MKTFTLCAFLLVSHACAEVNEAYLIVQVAYEASNAGQYSLISLRRNSGPPTEDDPYELVLAADEEEHIIRRIAFHAEGPSETTPTLPHQLRLALCSTPEKTSCTVRIIDLENAFAKGHVRTLCFDFKELPGSQFVVNGKNPDEEQGVALCAGEDDHL